jgi:hypothetical protein
MTSDSVEASVTTLSVRVESKEFPPYDPFHGTNQQMIWRRVLIETAIGIATFEQTDYGHAGRLNPWETRGVDPRLLPKLRQLEALADAAVKTAI